MKTLVVFLFAAMVIASSVYAATGTHIKQAVLKNKGGVVVASGDVNGDGKIIISLSSISVSDANASLLLLTTSDGKQLRVAVGDVTGDGATEYAVVSPRDPASGQATGKSAGGSGMGAGKVSMQDFHFVVNPSSGQVTKSSSSTSAQSQAKTSGSSIAVSVQRKGNTIEIASWSFGASNPSAR